MAAYRWVCGFGYLRADCRGPGSAPEPYARFEYGTTVAFTAFDVMLQFATIQVTRLVSSLAARLWTLAANPWNSKYGTQQVKNDSGTWARVNNIPVDVIIGCVFNIRSLPSLYLCVFYFVLYFSQDRTDVWVNLLMLSGSEDKKMCLLRLENEQQKPFHIASKTIKFCSMIEPKFCYEECRV